MIDYQKLLSPRILAAKPSGIRRFFDIAAGMEGVISLGVGEPDFRAGPAARQAAAAAMESGRTAYTGNAGLPELRREIADTLARRFALRYNPGDEVLVTVGGSEAIDLCIRCLAGPGDEVLVTEPSFVCYTPLAEMCGARAVPVPTVAEENFCLTPERLRAALTPRAKLLVLPFPANPTGAVMPRAALEAIAEVLRGTDVMILSDEIYAELTYTGERHVSIAELPGMRERTVVVGGFSKAYAMTGWRLGYACGPAPVIEPMLKLHQYTVMCAPTLSQIAAVEAMKNGDGDIAAMRADYNTRRHTVLGRLRGMGLPCFEPGGAFYAFPDIRSTGLSSAAFAEGLLEAEKVAVVPGDAFGESGEGYVRLSYSYSMEHLTAALDRMERFVHARR